MQAFTDRDKMPFGKYKGKEMANVPAPYLLWLYDEGCSHQGVRQYILANLKGLQQENSKIKR
jgi:uncharacterized protein (DUF3820 family)